ncbi:MAG: carboxylating nicotinate-nucleotide diphosphorylase [Anaerolineales bacterium]|nr:carboxylating nicotinate-nucleotide diphosphorylase [Anaerolineales bacterium]
MKREYRVYPTNLYERLPEALRHPSVLLLIEFGLAEDLAPDADLASIDSLISERDITTAATLDTDAHLQGQISAKAEGVIAGLPVAGAVFAQVDTQVVFTTDVKDGQRVKPNDVVAQVSGPGRALLAGERLALNFLGRMSGVATLTCKYMDAVAGTQAVILDTRKTAPGWRVLDKYAVRAGGGQNHRQGLYDMVLIKDNHIDGAGGIIKAVERVRQHHGDKYPIEVEVKNLIELEEALSLRPDRVMLDNMSLETMRRAVEIAAGRVSLEASGNVTLETVRAIAETGVDFISVGALTHSAPVFDVSMRLL